MLQLRLIFILLTLTLLLPGAAFAAAPPQKNQLSPAISEKIAIREREARRKKIDQERAKGYEGDQDTKKRPSEEIIIHPKE